MVIQTRFKDMVGIGHIALPITIIAIIIGAIIEYKFFIPLDFPIFNAIITGIVLISIGGLIIYSSLLALPISKRSRCLSRKGPYGFVRHPTYSATIFCIVPGIALLFRSKALLIEALLLYLLFHLMKKSEEKYMKYIFRDEYVYYSTQVPPFFPKLYDKKVLRKIKNLIIPHEGTEGYIDLCKK